jgi:hypothetical protein
MLEVPTYDVRRILEYAAFTERRHDPVTVAT